MLATKVEGPLAPAGPATNAGVTSASGSSNRSVRIDRQSRTLEGQEKLGEIGHLLVGEPEVEADGVVEGQDVVEEGPPGDGGSVAADVPVERMASEPPGEEVAGRRGVPAAAVVEVGRREAEAQQRRRVETGDGAVGADLAGIEGRVARHDDPPVGLT